MEVIASEFARMAGVSPMAVSKRIKSGTLIRNSAKKLDTDNPVNRAYLERMQSKIKSQLEMRAMEAAVAHGGGGVGVSAPLPDGSVPVAGEASRGNASFSDIPQSQGARADFAAQAAVSSGAGNRGARANVNPLATSDSAAEMLRLPVGQLVRKYGSVDAIEKYSKILRDLSTADEREQRTQEKRLLQIPKDFVVQRVFGYVDSLMGQLLDVPEAVCDQVIAVSLAGGDCVRASVMHIISDSLTRCISGAKEHIQGELNALKGKYDKRESAVQELVAQEIERMGEAG